MLPEIYWVEEAKPGMLGVMARPRGGEWLAQEADGWHKLSVSTVVSLLRPDEIRELGLAEEMALCSARGIRFMSHPIEDRGVPSAPAKFRALAQDLASQVRAKAAVVVHCRAGIGRSGLLAATVLAELGLPVKSAFPAVSRARRLQCPDTNEQADWFLSERWRL
jgi:protein-tyrosine phosphatase